jgi:acyl carrier protein
MINPTNVPENQNHSLDQYRLELLDAILTEENIYPWSLTEETTESYFNNLELLEIDDADISTDNFFSSLDSCWQSFDNSRLEMSLRERFGLLIPSEWYTAIASQAKKIITEELAGIDQLIKCVQPLLTNWGEEDLQTFARPFVYATRTAKKAQTEEINWDNLSEVKKARLTVEMAHFALTELNKQVDN